MAAGKHGTQTPRIIIIGAICFLVLLVTALCFVVVLKPADSEYNNTIPAFMGVLGIVTSAVSALLLLLKQDQQHKENTAKIETVVHKLESEPAPEYPET